MCTTALQSALPGRLILACNRDELATRKQALPPLVQHLPRGVAAIFPRDGDAGGTWVGVNTAGIVASLLNNYAADVHPLPNNPKSRGHIVPNILACLNLDEATQRIEDMRPELDRFRPFWLIVAWVPEDSIASALRATWDGNALRIEAVSLPMAQTSSSFEYSIVEPSRRAQIQGLLQDELEWTVDTTNAYFGSHLPVRGAKSICMHREDANTVSHTRIEVSADEVLLSYVDTSLCQEPDGTRPTIRLPRPSI